MRRRHQNETPLTGPDPKVEIDPNLSPEQRDQLLRALPGRITYMRRRQTKLPVVVRLYVNDEGRIGFHYDY